MKVVDFDIENEEQNTRVFKQIDFNIKLIEKNIPNILKFVGFIESDISGIRNIKIVHEYGATDLKTITSAFFDDVKELKKYSEDEIMLLFFIPTVITLRDLQRDLQASHLNLKPENFIVLENGKMKLSDF